jgi:hypothetical protein
VFIAEGQFLLEEQTLNKTKSPTYRARNNNNNNNNNKAKVVPVLN